MSAVARVPEELRPHVRRQIRRYYAVLLGSQVAVATALWPLTRHEGVYLPLSSLIGFALVERWQWWRRRDQYLARLEVGGALRTSAEPRPHLRAAVDREAEGVLREHQLGLGVVHLVFGGLALAVVGAAVFRGDPVAALWAIPSVGVGALWLRHLRTARRRAQDWLGRTPAPSREVRP